MGAGEMTDTECIDEIQEHADASARGEKPDTVIAMAVEDYMNEILEEK